MTDLEQMWCTQCADRRPFEQLACADGHRVDCPERACTVCGGAVLVADWPDSAVPAVGERPLVVRVAA